ncbi:MAG: hypothetical protein HOE90_06830 [Bacteriovoracaceae bacterium]|nr:hypothetical protein [Bacteriovoracaceae bacterium]
MKNTITCLLLVLLSHNTFAKRACQRIRFLAIKPQLYQSKQKIKCNDAIDRTHCQILRSYAQIKKNESINTKLPVLKVQKDFSIDYDRLISPLEDSPVLQQMSNMRIEARKISGWDQNKLCSPTLIYMGKKKIFGLGPVFLDSTKFDLNGRIYENALLIEPGNFRGLPFKALKKEDLRSGGYFDIVVAHELAHNLMQDLYGAEDFEKSIYPNLHSKDWHMVSSTTDPTLAWIEGFAEGFEAFLGETSLDQKTLDSTPEMDELMASFQNSLDQAQDYGILQIDPRPISEYPALKLPIQKPKGLLAALPRTIKTTLKVLKNISAFSTDLLKLSRQKAIRENHYVLKGDFNNLSHHYGTSLALSLYDYSNVESWQVEDNTDTLYSKEGVVAHIVYTILKLNLSREMFQAIHEVKPQNLHQFLQAFLPKLWGVKKQTMKLRLFSTFSPLGRLYAKNCMKYYYQETARTEDDYKNMLTCQHDILSRNFVTKPFELPAPRTPMWAEFDSVSGMKKFFSGKLDRLNVKTAPPWRIQELFNGAFLPFAVNNVNDTGLTAILKGYRDLYDETRKGGQYVKHLDIEISEIILGIFLEVRAGNIEEDLETLISKTTQGAYHWIRRPGNQSRMGIYSNTFDEVVRWIMIRLRSSVNCFGNSCIESQLKK